MPHIKLMKTNGIVRKVDGLGRVVIPREYRKLHKISLGDPMEISCMENGEIVLRKMDMTLALEDLSASALRALSESTTATVLVSNTEKWIGGCGELKGKFIGKEIPDEMREDIKRREQWSSFDVTAFLPDVPGKLAIVARPIAGDCDVFGSLCVVREERVSESDIALINAVASVLGSSLQKF